MRSIFTFLLFCVLGFQVKAQWVDLPDFFSVRGTCIRYNSDLEKYQLDTDCAQSIAKASIRITQDGGASVSGLLDYYQNAEELELVWIEYDGDIFFYDFSKVSRKLKSLSLNISRTIFPDEPVSYKEMVLQDLPQTLEDIKIITESFNKYSVEKWPESLKTLAVFEGGGVSIGEIYISTGFPTSLEYLTLFFPLTDMTSWEFPSGLKSLNLSVLDFNYNRLNSFQELENAYIINHHTSGEEINVNVLNPMLKNLQILGTDTTEAVTNESVLNIDPSLSSLESLSISGYRLKSISSSEQLKEIILNNVIDDISPVVNALPAHTHTLKITHSQIDTLIRLPEELRFLGISSSDIKNLPNFPLGLDTLKLSSLDKLMCLPYFPDNLKRFEAWGLGDVKCIPNETNYVKATTQWPVCTDVQYICNTEEYTIVKGTVYYDLNKNGLKDAGDIPVYGGVLSLNEETFATANKDGVYKLILREQGTFEIKAVSNHPNVLAILPAIKTIVYDENYENDSIHFLIQVEDVKDLKITGTNLVARPGMQTSATAFIENLGVNDLSDVTVKIKKPQDWSVESVTPEDYRTDNDTIIWENVNFAKLSNTSFKVQTQLPATATILGNPYQYEMWVSSTSQEDVTPTDNYYKIIDTIIGSYDPNDKIVNYTSLTPENSNAQELVYTIRFQNTGTDTAFKVIVIDTIIGNLNPSSIRVLGASHDFTWEYIGQGIAAFTFDNILLPDSNVNELASHGFVTLAVKANKDLAVGDSIYNRAGIYFDFNEPVITNKALTRIATVTSVYTYANTSLKIYPNPAKDRVRVEWSSNERATLRLLDISGKVMQSQTLNQNYSDIDVSRLSKGMYLIQVQLAEGLSVGKLLIK